MRRWWPDTNFGRLFGLLILALLFSHVIITLVLASHLLDGAVGPRISPRPPPPPTRIILFIIAVESIVLTGAAWLGARVLTTPVRRMMRAASQLADDLNHPAMEETGTAEARQAAQLFNQMQARLRSQIQERGRFLAAVSHDLRTPLTRIKMRMGSLEEDLTKQKMLADVAEMSALLDATLEYLRGEEQREAWQVVDVQALLESIADDSQDSGMDVAMCGTARPISTRPLALRRCLSNLVDNAVRYGTRARITLTDSLETVTIEIVDAGPGIPDDKLELVFEPYYRVEGSRSKELGGYGLGLSIARSIATQCGATLALQNHRDGGLLARIQLQR